MKKLFLLFAAGFSLASAMAQENNSVIFLPSAKFETNVLGAHLVTNPPIHAMTNSNASHQRTTSGVVTNCSDWFDYAGQNTSTSRAGTFYYFVTYPDSNLLDNTSSPSYNAYTHGLGMSFDPTDGAYYGTYGASGSLNVIPITDGIITDTNAYTIDSFRAPFQYMHNVNTTGVDSLIIEIISCSHATGTGSTAVFDSGTFMLQFGADAANYPITHDSTPRFAAPIYTRQTSALGANEVWDSISAIKQRFAFALTIADTGTGQGVNFGLTTPLQVEAGRKVISFMHFKSAQNFALGTTVGSANWIKLFSGTPAATSSTFPVQTAHDDPGVPPGYGGSYQTGLIAQNQVRYEDTGFAYSGHNILIPGVDFSAPDLTVPLQAFHVTWTIVNSLGVANVNHTISTASVFPNPATNTVNVTFNLSTEADATVTLTNAVGQVVATEVMNNVNGGKASFNTSSLPSGLYIYTVVANGERTSGSVSVAH